MPSSLEFLGLKPILEHATTIFLDAWAIIRRRSDLSGFSHAARRIMIGRHRTLPTDALADNSAAMLRDHFHGVPSERRT